MYLPAPAIRVLTASRSNDVIVVDGGGSAIAHTRPYTRSAADYSSSKTDHYWPLGVRRSIAGFAIEGLTKFHAHDLEACWNGFHVKIVGPLLRP